MTAKIVSAALLCAIGCTTLIASAKQLRLQSDALERMHLYRLILTNGHCEIAGQITGSGGFREVIYRCDDGYQSESAIKARLI